MSIAETHRNLGDIFRAAALEGAIHGVPAIVPWRMDANQDHADIGLDQCGCGFCPDDGQETA